MTRMTDPEHPRPTSGATFDRFGALHCECGNTPDHAAFTLHDWYTYYEHGAQITMTSTCHECNQCGRVYAEIFGTAQQITNH